MVFPDEDGEVRMGVGNASKEDHEKENGKHERRTAHDPPSFFF